MFKPNRINIHELTIEEPEKQSELSFDPDREITEADWRGMRDNLEYCRQHKEWQAFSSHAMKMKILDSSIDLKLDQTAWKGMEKELNENKEHFRWEGFTNLATAIKILDPTKDLSPNLDQAAWQGMRDQLERDRKSDLAWLGVSPQAMDMKILDSRQDLNLSTTDWEDMRSQLEEYRQSHNWANFSQQAMRMKVLNPRLDLNLDEVAWQGMSNHLEAHRKSYDSATKWINICDTAMAMKILAAEEVKVTDKGLEITMRKPKLTSGVPPLPETKKF